MLVVHRLHWEGGVVHCTLTALGGWPNIAKKLFYTNTSTPQKIFRDSELKT